MGFDAWTLQESFIGFIFVTRCSEIVYISEHFHGCIVGCVQMEISPHLPASLILLVKRLYQSLRQLKFSYFMFYQYIDRRGCWLLKLYYLQRPSQFENNAIAEVAQLSVSFCIIWWFNSINWEFLFSILDKILGNSGFFLFLRQFLVYRNFSHHIRKHDNVLFLSN